ncbi:phosphotransferase, partial [Streptomyces sp. NPDC058953]|uniref:phosphotransferase n=1 Tax=Streptomyces sp. NPDC058953 TaxID=3346676 RepID=UPI0036C2AF65
MPVPVQRDPERTRRALAAWLTARAPEAGTVDVGPVRVPGTAGFSGEILLCDAAWADGSVDPLAVRVAPTGHRVHPDDRWTEQVRLHEILTGTRIRVAPLLGHEPDASVLGAPFLVMRRVEGRVPADLPSYHREGWLAELPPRRRRAVWLGGVETLAAIHHLDPLTAGLGFLGQPVTAHGTGGTDGDRLTGQLADYAARLPFYGAERNEVAAAALGWLRDRLPGKPPEPRVPGLPRPLSYKQLTLPTKRH